MKLSNLTERILLFVIAIPALLLIIIVFPHFNHLLLNLVVAAFCVLGAMETRRLFSTSVYTIPRPIPWLVLLFPLNFYCLGMGWLQVDLTIPILISQIAVILTMQLHNQEDFSRVLGNTSAALLVLIYPGLLLAFVGRLSHLPDPVWVILLYIGLVMGNDTLAYLIGKGFGKRSKGVLKVSPGKSLVGFIGGVCGSFLFALVFYVLKPSIFHGHLSIALVLGAIGGFLTIIGDLIESALKRSAGVKDSGDLMPGRGGILDTVDSLSLVAPAMYYILDLLARIY